MPTLTDSAKEPSTVNFTETLVTHAEQEPSHKTKTVNLFLFAPITGNLGAYDKLIEKLTELLKPNATEGTINLNLNVVKVSFTPSMKVPINAVIEKIKDTILKKEYDNCLFLGYSAGGYVACALMEKMESSSITCKAVILDTEPLVQLKEAFKRKFASEISGALHSIIDTLKILEEDKTSLKNDVSQALQKVSQASALADIATKIENFTNEFQATKKPNAATLFKSRTISPVVELISTIIMPYIKNILELDLPEDVPALVEDGRILKIIMAAKTKENLSIEGDWQNKITTVPNTTHYSLLSDQNSIDKIAQELKTIIWDVLRLSVKEKLRELLLVAEKLGISPDNLGVSPPIHRSDTPAPSMGP